MTAVKKYNIEQPDERAARAGGLREEHVRRRQEPPVRVPRARRATKPEIKAAVELMFKIKVDDVHRR